MAAPQNTEAVTMYYINLDRREDRRAHMEEEFKEAVASNALVLSRWSAVAAGEGWKGCILSHAAVLKHLTADANGANDAVGTNAATNKSGLYCILEDDCTINNKDGFSQMLPKYLKYLKEHASEWDLFLGGGIYVIPTRIVCRDPFIIQCDWIACSHFVIYNDVTAQKVIKYAEEGKYDVGIDNFNARSNRNRIWVPYPFMCDQLGTDTDIGNYDDYLVKIRNAFKASHKILDDFVKKNGGGYK